MNINRNEYLEKLEACWLGKNIGGTLGAPMEWRRQVNNVSFYTQELDGSPIPNDDLDIQLIWLLALEEQGPDTDARTLAGYWEKYLTPHWSEYGISKANLRTGLIPPLSGSVNNKFKHSCGAFIRSEIWACIAPGCPSLAVKFAYEDAIIDHGNGEGTYAEIFCAAIESAAFALSDIRELIDIGLSYIPGECAVAKAVRAVIREFDAGRDWLSIREMILKDFRGHFHWYISREDLDKGFDTGEMGFDAPSNIGIVVLGLLLSEKNSFDRIICTTVNCGEDTDCTAATVGAVYGIIHGKKGIPEKWIDPIGRQIKTKCINLGDAGNRIPANISEFTGRIEKMALQVMGRFKSCRCSISDAPSSLDPAPVQCNLGRRLSGDEPVSFSRGGGNMRGRGGDEKIYRYMNSTVFRFPFFSVAVDYGEEGPFIESAVARKITVRLESSMHQVNVSARIYTPDASWRVNPETMLLPCFHRSNLAQVSAEFEFCIVCDNVLCANNRLIVDLIVEGTSVNMLVPITLLNGN